MKILLANPRGFCAGVERAIEIVERALDLFGAPIYVRHEVVHNRYVVEGLRERGTVFVDELDEVPDGATVIFSAHGVARTVHAAGKRRGLRVFDATCPLVTKVHLEVSRHADAARECILIGHRGHPEVEGTMGQYDVSRGGAMYLVETPDDVRQLELEHPDNVAFVTQTTLSVDDTARVIDALRERFPGIIGPRKDDICYATQNRQDAVKSLAEECDVILVVGSPNSSNSNRLRELAINRGVPAYLIDVADQIHRDWVGDNDTIGVTAGASAPEALVEGVITRLKSWGATSAQEYRGRQENVTFSLPKVLQGQG
ncbi:MAG: 4-hydroxy-3-methylbut-2-enyl diphosphate reductase [Gammaproteobacteria bacterium]